MALFNPLVKYDGPRWSAGGLSGTEQADDGRKYREDDDHGNHIVNVFAYVGDEMAERIAAKDRGANPQAAAKKIKKKIAGIGHFCGARDGRTESSNDGDESGKDHSSTAVFLVEIVGTLEMATAEKEGILAAVYGSPRGTADPVADLVAGDSTKHDGPEKPLQGNDASVGEDADSDQKGVARKKKADEEAGFNKDDGANERSAAGAD